MKSTLAILILLFQLAPLNDSQADIVADLAELFKQGNSRDIARNFANSVELIIIDQEDVYSKVQAEQILKDFFLKNLPSKAAIVHRLDNNPNYRLGILNLQTKTGKFRVTISLSLRRPQNTFQITELRIETDKQ